MSGVNNQIKTGSYAVSTVYSMPWSKKTAAPVKTKKKRVEKKVVHEIFEFCSELTTDPYWTSVFRECARDKFPRGFSYKNGLMIHRRGNKLKRIPIPNSPYEALSASISFFKESGGLMSATDRKKIQKEEEERLLESISMNMEWKDIKAERVKEILISEFVNDLARKMKFDNEKKMELVTTVKSGFMLKYFSGKNITMDEGKVIDIEGLVLDKDKNRFYIDPKYTSKRPGRKVKGLGIERVNKKPKVSFLNIWEKYLQGLDKNNTVNELQIIDSISSYDNTDGETSVTDDNFTDNYSTPINTTDT